MRSVGDFYCPECGKKAGTATPGFVRYSFRRLALVIFLCSSCRLIYIDKPTLRWQISEWRNNEWCSWGAKAQPFEKLYKEFLGELEDSVKNYWSKIGYKPKRFKKSPH